MTFLKIQVINKGGQGNTSIHVDVEQSGHVDALTGQNEVGEIQMKSLRESLSNVKKQIKSWPHKSNRLILTSTYSTVQ